MPLNASGPISIGGSTAGESINLELGRTATQQSALEEASLRTLAGKGTPGSVISLSDFYGKSNDTYWMSRLSGAQQPKLRRVTTDSSGNIYAAGTQAVYGTDALSGNIAVVKYNSSGTVIWQVTCGTSSPDYLWDILAGDDGSVYIAAFNIVNQLNVYKLNSNGTKNLTRRINGPSGYENGGGLAWNLNKTQILMTADAMSIHVFDTNWNWQSSKLIGPTGVNIVGQSVTIDPSGNIYFGGSGANATSGAVAKANSSGVIQWARTLTHPGGNASGVVSVDTSGNVYIAGFGRHVANGVNWGYVAKYNTSGTLQWKRTWNQGNSTQTLFYYILATSTGCYACGLHTGASNARPHRALLVKYNTNGVLEWQRYFFNNSLISAGTTEDWFYGINQTASGALLLAGYSRSSASIVDMTVWKLPADGSKTGTYGNYIYSASSLTEQDGTALTSGDPGWTGGARTSAQVTGDYPVASMAFTGGITTFS